MKIIQQSIMSKNKLPTKKDFIKQMSRYFKLKLDLYGKPYIK